VGGVDQVDIHLAPNGAQQRSGVFAVPSQEQWLEGGNPDPVCPARLRRGRDGIRMLIGRGPSPFRRWRKPNGAIDSRLLSGHIGSTRYWVQSDGVCLCCGLFHLAPRGVKPILFHSVVRALRYLAPEINPRISVGRNRAIWTAQKLARALTSAIGWQIQADRARLLGALSDAQDPQQFPELMTVGSPAATIRLSSPRDGLPHQ